MGFTIKVADFDSFEKAFGVFKRLSRESLEEYRERAYYRKPSDIKREKKQKAIRKKELRKLRRDRDDGNDYNKD